MPCQLRLELGARCAAPMLGGRRSRWRCCISFLALSPSCRRQPGSSGLYLYALPQLRRASFCCCNLSVFIKRCLPLHLLYLLKAQSLDVASWLRTSSLSVAQTLVTQHHHDSSDDPLRKMWTLWHAASIVVDLRSRLRCTLGCSRLRRRQCLLPHYCCAACDYGHRRHWQPAGKASGCRRQGQLCVHGPGGSHSASSREIT